MPSSLLVTLQGTKAVRRGPGFSGSPCHRALDRCHHRLCPGRPAWPPSQAWLLGAEAGGGPPHSALPVSSARPDAGSVRSLSVCPGACGDLLEPLAFGVPCSSRLVGVASPAEHCHGKGDILPLVASTLLDPRSFRPGPGPCLGCLAPPPKPPVNSPRHRLRSAPTRRPPPGSRFLPRTCSPLTESFQGALGRSGIPSD